LVISFCLKSSSKSHSPFCTYHNQGIYGYKNISVAIKKLKGKKGELTSLAVRKLTAGSIPVAIKELKGKKGELTSLAVWELTAGFIFKHPNIVFVHEMAFLNFPTKTGLQVPGTTS
jgi:hypothetical protein